MKRLIAAMLTATLLPLAACTSQPAVEPDASGTETASPTSNVVTTTPTATTRGATTSSTSSTTATSLATASLVEPAGDKYDAIPVEIPDSISGSELSAANEAIEVWRNAIRVFDESMQDPGAKDWKPSIYEYVNDPAALKQMSTIATFKEQGFHQIGQIEYTAEILSAVEHNVQISACVDLTNYDVIDVEGDSVIRQGQPRTFVRIYSVSFYHNQDPSLWFLNNVTTPDPVEPC
jgi:hypothetical protein